MYSVCTVTAHSNTLMCTIRVVEFSLKRNVFLQCVEGVTSVSVLVKAVAVSFHFFSVTGNVLDKFDQATNVSF